MVAVTAARGACEVFPGRISRVWTWHIKPLGCLDPTFVADQDVPLPEPQLLHSLAMRLSAALTPVVAAAPTALAWGAMGHQAIAYIATNFVSASTKTYFQGLLGDTSGDYLAAVSTWADSYRSTTAGKFSAPFHYIDANDSPPSSCGVELARDCGKDGCVVSAIANYVRAPFLPCTLSRLLTPPQTSQLLDGKLSKAQRQIAAKMIIHVRTPLHHPPSPAPLFPI